LAPARNRSFSGTICWAVQKLDLGCFEQVLSFEHRFWTGRTATI
jgi:hypothetical protein